MLLKLMALLIFIPVAILSIAYVCIRMTDEKSRREVEKKERLETLSTLCFKDKIVFCFSEVIIEVIYLIGVISPW